MAWSSIHRGDYRRLRRNLTVALLEAEALEPRLQLAFARGEIPDSVAANMGLVRLMLERSDHLIRSSLDIAIADTASYYHVYADTFFTDRQLAEAGGLEAA